MLTSPEMLEIALQAARGLLNEAEVREAFAGSSPEADCEHDHLASGKLGACVPCMDAIRAGSTPSTPVADDYPDAFREQLARRAALPAGSPSTPAACKFCDGVMAADARFTRQNPPILVCQSCGSLWSGHDNSWAAVEPDTTEPVREALAELVEAVQDAGGATAWQDAAARKGAAALAGSRPPEPWTPTSENINALPQPIRAYIMELETNADPAGMVRRAILAEEQRDALLAAPDMASAVTPPPPERPTP